MVLSFPFHEGGVRDHPGMQNPFAHCRHGFLYAGIKNALPRIFLPIIALLENNGDLNGE